MDLLVADSETWAVISVSRRRCTSPRNKRSALSASGACTITGENLSPTMNAAAAAGTIHAVETRERGAKYQTIYVVMILYA